MYIYIYYIENTGRLYIIDSVQGITPTGCFDGSGTCSSLLPTPPEEVEVDKDDALLETRR